MAGRGELHLVRYLYEIQAAKGLANFALEKVGNSPSRSPLRLSLLEYAVLLADVADIQLRTHTPKQAGAATQTPHQRHMAQAGARQKRA